MTWTDLAVLSGALLFAVGLTAATRRSRSERPASPSAPAPPHEPTATGATPSAGERALEKLDVLRGEVDPQVRVNEIAAVARAFVSAHFGVVADASSHADMLDHLQGSLSPQHIDPLRRALRMADHALHGRPATSHQLPDALELELRTFILTSLPNPSSD